MKTAGAHGDKHWWIFFHLQSWRFARDIPLGKIHFFFPPRFPPRVFEASVNVCHRTRFFFHIDGFFHHPCFFPPPLFFFTTPCFFSPPLFFFHHPWFCFPPPLRLFSPPSFSPVMPVYFTMYWSLVSCLAGCLAGARGQRLVARGQGPGQQTRGQGPLPGARRQSQCQWQTN